MKDNLKLQPILNVFLVLFVTLIKYSKLDPNQGVPKIGY